MEERNKKEPCGNKALDEWDEWDEETKKRLRIMYYQQFSKEYGCFQYAIWACLFGLFADAGYKAIVGGDWQTPILCLGGLLIFGVVTYIIASLG